jgi:hypothetical protein
VGLVEGEREGALIVAGHHFGGAARAGVGEARIGGGGQPRPRGEEVAGALGAVEEEHSGVVFGEVAFDGVDVAAGVGGLAETAGKAVACRGVEAEVQAIEHDGIGIEEEGLLEGAEVEHAGFVEEAGLPGGLVDVNGQVGVEAFHRGHGAGEGGFEGGVGGSVPDDVEDAAACHGWSFGQTRRITLTSDPGEASDPAPFTPQTDETIREQG